jgi:hypothetical protein
MQRIARETHHSSPFKEMRAAKAAKGSAPRVAKNAGGAKEEPKRYSAGEMTPS